MNQGLARTHARSRMLQYLQAGLSILHGSENQPLPKVQRHQPKRFGNCWLTQAEMEATGRPCWQAWFAKDFVKLNLEGLWRCQFCACAGCSCLRASSCKAKRWSKHKTVTTPRQPLSGIPCLDCAQHSNPAILGNSGVAGYLPPWRLFGARICVAS